MASDSDIQAKAISPVAATRIFRTAATKNTMRPESVAPAALVLKAQEGPFTGKVIHAVNGRFRINQFETTHTPKSGREITPEQLLTQLYPKMPKLE